MVQVAQHETAVAMSDLKMSDVETSDAEMSALAYAEAAEGDLARALLWALEDLIACEIRLVRTQGAVSQGFVRAALQAVARPGR